MFLEASEEFREGSLWHKAAAVLGESDNRVLVLGPGQRSRLAPVTEGLRLFLSEVGFQASTLDQDYNVSEHREQAARYPLIVALPISVGSSAEVLDFSAREQLRKRLAVVLPRDYHVGFLARLLKEEHSVVVQACGEVPEQGGAVDAEVGKQSLMALHRLVIKGATTAAAAEQTENVHEPASLAAREEGSLQLLVNDRALTNKLIGLGVLSGAAIVGLALFTEPYVLVPAAFILVLLTVLVVLAALTAAGRLDGGQFLRGLSDTLSQLPLLRELFPGAKQLPPADSPAGEGPLGPGDAGDDGPPQLLPGRRAEDDRPGN